MSKWYPASNLTPLDPQSLQAIPDPGDYTDLVTGDMCFVMVNDLYTRIYQYDETLADAGDYFKTIVIPDGNVSGTGAWKEKRTTGIMSFWAGTVANQIDAVVTESGGVVSLDFECTGSIPGVGIWSDDLITIPIQSVTLSHGSDVAPTANYVYILKAAPTTLVAGSSWPITEHVRIAYALVPSATYVAANGAYIIQNWNDGNESNGMGHLSALGENVRLTQDGAHWHSGVAGNGVTDGYITIVTADTPDSAYFVSTAGSCFQMHRHTIPAFNSQTEEILFANAYGQAYKPLNDIRDETVDALNVALVNRYYNIVFWMVANKSGAYSPLMANMPTGSYVGLSSAIADVDGYDVYDIPREFKEDSATGFLICRITFRQTATAITVHNTTDLRGQLPGTASGTSTTSDTEFADNQFKVFNVSDVSRIVDMDLSGITSSNTRTITPADADMTLLSATQYTDLTDGGETSLHEHTSLFNSAASVLDTTAEGIELVGNGGGVKFPATQVASTNANTLDDYEEGSWTPVLYDATSGGNGASIGTATGSYVKVGNMVTLHFTVANIDTTGMTAGNILYLRGLPFTQSSTHYGVGSVVLDQFTITGESVALRVVLNTSYATFTMNTSASGDTGLLVSDVSSSTADAFGTVPMTL